MRRTLKRTDMRQMKEHRPKFKVGDNVKHIWSDNATTVAEITSKGYRMESGGEFVDFEDEFFWELAHKPEPTTKPTHKFKIGDIVQRKDGCFFQYKITGYDGDDYVAVDTFKLKRGLKSQFDITKISRNDNDYELVEKAESNVQPIEPKFKIGDKVKHKVVDPNNPATRYIYTVFEIEDGKYCLDHNDHESYIPIGCQDEFELVGEPEREHKFILGDIVVRAKHGVYGERYFIQRIDDVCYIAYPYGVYGDLSDKEYKIWYDEENEWELFSDAVRLSTEPEKFECTVSLEQINTDIDEIWKNTLVNMTNHITKRNAASFMYIIDETLRYMDCDAYVEDARAGMRQFVKELKKRLGV